MNIKKPIRLIAFDLDGTLLNEKYELTSELKVAIQQARRSNLVLIVATGRDRKSAEAFLQELGLTHIAITSGGALTWLDGKIILQLSFSREQFKEILRIGQEYQTGILIDQPDQTWNYGNQHYVDMYSHLSDSLRMDQISPMLNPMPIKVSVIQEYKVIEEIREKIAQLYPELGLVRPFDQILDINPSGASKGAALLGLENRLGISMDEIAVVGDSENDISMFKVAGRSYAMGNAPEHVQKAADYVVSGNDQNGAAEAIKSILEFNQRN